MDDRTWELLMDRLEGIEGSINCLDKKVAGVLKLKWWIMGAAAAMSVGSSSIIGIMSEGERIYNPEAYSAVSGHPPSILLDEQDTGDIRSDDAPLEKGSDKEGSFRHSRSPSVGEILRNRGKVPNG